MAFAFSKGISSSNLSLIDWSEVSGQRWDARYHMSISHKPHWIKLGKYVRIRGGKRLPKRSSFSADITPYRYLKVENLEESGIDYPNMPYIDEETYSVLKRYSLAESDVVLSIAGTIGKVSIFHQQANEEVILTENCAKLRTTSSHISPEFLRILLQCSFAQEQMAVAAPQTTIQKLALERIAQILVPAVLNSKQQQDAVAIFTNAESQRRSKESEAQRLLDSIDDYLLQELGITLPPDGSNTIQDRMFKKELSEIAGGRWDSIYHQTNVFHLLQNSRFTPTILRRLATYFKSGFSLKREDQVKSEKGIIQLRPTNISVSGDLVLTKIIQVPKSMVRNSSDLLQVGEVLFNNTNSQDLVGKTTVLNRLGDFCASNHLTRIYLQEQMLPDYLCSILNLYRKIGVFYRLCTNWNNQSGVGNDVLRKILIPLPRLDDQKRIVAHMNGTREKAEGLRQEAFENVQAAKAEVERMIQGG